MRRVIHSIAGSALRVGAVGLAAMLATTTAAAANSKIGAIAPGFCDASGHAPAPGVAPEGYALTHTYATCAELEALSSGRSGGLQTFGYVFTPEIASPWEQPADDDAADATPTPTSGPADAFATMPPADGDEMRSIRLLNRPEPGEVVRRPASFRVDHSAEAALDALAASTPVGEAIEIGRWREGDDMRLSASFERVAPAEEGAEPITRMRMVSHVRWPGRGGVTRVLVMPYRNGDTLRYMRAQLRASAAADRIARQHGLR